LLGETAFLLDVFAFPAAAGETRPENFAALGEARWTTALAFGTELLADPQSIGAGLRFRRADEPERYDADCARRDAPTQ
jgi:hypothetical protein